MLKKNNLQLGFTLIEVIIVIGIAGLLMAVSIPAEISYRQKAELKQSVKDLRSLYWDAQSRSLAPRVKNVVAYEIDIFKSSIGPFDEKECLNMTNTGCANSISQVELGQNIIISDIKCVSGSANIAGHLATYFVVGNNKSSGNMIFYNGVGGSEINCDKIEILMASSLTSLQYKIVLDKINNSIDYTNS